MFRRNMIFDADALWLKNIHLFEAALVLRALDLQESEQNVLIEEVKMEVFRTVLISQEKYNLEEKE